jgi:hypothetical protein
MSYQQHLNDTDWTDPDPAPRDWLRTDPHSPNLESFMLDEPDYDGWDLHIKPSTAHVEERESEYQLGRHRRTRITRIITTRG